MDFKSFTMDDAELRQVIEEFAPKGRVRSYDELYEDARKKMDSAVVHYQVKKFADVRKEFVVANNDVTKDNIIDSADNTNPIPNDVLLKVLFEFAFIFGNYNDRRSWIRVDAKTFVRFPNLIENKGHSTFVMLYAKAISRKLEKVDNAFLSILLKNKVVVNPAKRMFCFSKGHLLNSDNRLAIIADLKVIFEQLNKKDVNQRSFAELRWFNN